MVMTAHPTGLPLKPEQTFFPDTANDRLLAMLMTIAARLHVACDRLSCLEMLLESGQPVTREALDRFQPSPEQATRLERDRQALVSELMRCSMGVEVSLGAPAEGVGRFDRS
jgi:hypothetical protein